MHFAIAPLLLVAGCSMAGESSSAGVEGAPEPVVQAFTVTHDVVWPDDSWEEVERSIVVERLEDGRLVSDLHVPGVELPPGELLELVMPRHSDVFAWDGSEHGRHWELESPRWLLIDGESWLPGAVPELGLDETIRRGPCVDDLCEVSWRRNGTLPHGMGVAWSQEGHGRYDRAARRYVWVAVTWESDATHGARAVSTRIVNDDEAADARLAERRLIRVQTEAAALDLDAWITDHPPEQQARQALRRTRVEIEEVIAFGASPSHGSEPTVSFHAIAHPQLAWAVALSEPPGPGRAWLLGAIWEAQRSRRIAVGDDVVARIVDLARHDADVARSMATVSDARLLPTLERIRDDRSAPWAVRDQANDSITSLTRGPVSPAALTETDDFSEQEWLVRTFLDQGGDARELLAPLLRAAEGWPAGTASREWVLGLLERVTHRGPRDSLDAWRRWVRAHGDEGAEAWAISALEGDNGRLAAAGARALALGDPSERATAALVAALEDERAEVRRAAAQTLVVWDDPRGLLTLVEQIAEGISRGDRTLLVALAPRADSTFGLERSSRAANELDHEIRLARLRAWAQREVEADPRP